MTITELIIALRKAKGWTTYKLAKEADINIQSMYMIEKGETSPNLTNICKISAALGQQIIVNPDGSFSTDIDYPFTKH